MTEARKRLLKPSNRYVMREFWINIVLTSGVRVYGYLIGFITLAVTARWLGPEGRGIIAAVGTWVALFVTFSDLSLGQVALHHAADHRDRNWLANVFGSLLLFCGLFALLGWLTAYALYLVTNGVLFDNLSPLFLLIGFIGLPLVIWDRYGSALLTALDQVPKYNWAQFIGRTVGLALIGLAWFFQWGIASVLVGLLISQVVISGITTAYLLRYTDDPIKADASVMRSFLKGGLKVHWNAIGAFMVMYTDILMINYYRGLEETGYYQVVVQMITIMYIIPTAAAMMLSGKVSLLGPDGAWPYNRTLMIWLTLAMIGFSIIAALSAPVIIPLIMGDRFDPVIPIFQWALLAMIGMSFSAVMGPQWIGRGWFWQSSLLTLFIGLGNLIAGLILIPIYGMYGAVWSTIATYILSLFINGGLAIWCEVRYRRAK